MFLFLSFLSLWERLGEGLWELLSIVFEGNVNSDLNQELCVFSFLSLPSGTRRNWIFVFVGGVNA